MSPKPKLTKEQKVAIGTYNAIHEGHISLHYSHGRVEFLNREVFGPQGIPLLASPGRRALLKSKVDKRYLSKVSKVSKAMPPKRKDKGIEGLIEEAVERVVRREFLRMLPKMKGMIREVRDMVPNIVASMSSQ
jgi:hypothetical protein